MARLHQRLDWLGGTCEQLIAKHNNLVEIFQSYKQIIASQGAIIDAIVNLSNYTPEQLEEEFDKAAAKQKAAIEGKVNATSETETPKGSGENGRE